ncbi:MAG: ATP-binding protein [Gemmatimonadales bacterium]
MIPRQQAKLARALAREFKILAVVGPRQAGKTTLARAVFAKKPYVNLEAPDTLLFATEDPRRFLAQYPEGAVIDEAQRCPKLFSYLQLIVDQRNVPGQFILTGSQHFGLMEQLTQSLAGRVGFLRLLPFSFGELHRAHCAPDSLEEMLFKGGYPPLYDQPVVPERWLDAYITTYVERDVRQLLNIRDLNSFQRFVRLCAGNVGQLLNMSRIGGDAGINQITVRSWLGILESSFIAFLLQPHRRNFRKRLVKTPKLFFYDPALAARLLGIESADQLITHPLRGALFENWVIVELLKGRAARGKADNLFFWRSHVGYEVDVIADHGNHLTPIEIKSGATIGADWMDGLLRWVDLAGSVARNPTLVYGGQDRQTRKGVAVIAWTKIDGLARKV